MEFVWISLGVLGALLLLLILMLLFGKAKIRIASKPDSDVKVALVICGIRIRILPLDKGIFKERQNSKIFKQIQEKIQENRQKKIAKREAGEYVPNFWQQMSLTFKLLKAVKKRVHNDLHIHVRRFRIEVASPDAAQTAILYGSLVGVCSWFWQWVQATWARVDRRRGAMSVYPNYLKTESSAEIDITLKMNTIKALFVIFDMIDAAKEENQKAEEQANLKAANQSSVKPIS